MRKFQRVAARIWAAEGFFTGWLIRRRTYEPAVGRDIVSIHESSFDPRAFELKSWFCCHS